jgi:hypothetical protein
MDSGTLPFEFRCRTLPLAAIVAEAPVMKEGLCQWKMSKDPNS